jgi:hypothetical protein
MSLAIDVLVFGDALATAAAIVAILGGIIAALVALGGFIFTASDRRRASRNEQAAQASGGPTSNPAPQPRKWSKVIVAIASTAAVFAVAGLVTYVASDSSAPRTTSPTTRVPPSSPTTRVPPASRSTTPLPTPPRTTPTVALPRLAILSPPNGAGVPEFADIKIAVAGLPEDRDVWILVQFRNDEHIFPQGACDTVALASTVCGGAEFGDAVKPSAASPAGDDHFTVTAVLISPADEARYRGDVYSHGFLQGKPPVTPLASSSPVTYVRV